MSTTPRLTDIHKKRYNNISIKHDDTFILYTIYILRCHIALLGFLHMRCKRIIYITLLYVWPKIANVQTKDIFCNCNVFTSLQTKLTRAFNTIDCHVSVQITNVLCVHLSL